MPYATVSDIEMYYEEYGTGEPLLITTGWALAERAHAHHRELFAESYRCIRHDHRGMGRSGAPDYPYTTQMMGDDLAGLLDHLGLENIGVLGGGGMGGLIAAQLAINHPDKVRSLFLGAGCARADNFLKTVMGVWKDLYDLDREIWARELALWVLTPETFNSRPELADNAWKGAAWPKTRFRRRVRSGASPMRIVRTTLPTPWAELAVRLWSIAGVTRT